MSKQVTDVNMSRSHALSPNSSIGILSLHDAQTESQTTAQTVVAMFQARSYLPGILILDSATDSAPQTILGVLSRQMLFEQGCLNAGDRGWDQPIENFLVPDQDPPILVTDRASILEVAFLIRQRLRIFALDPVVVSFRDGSLRLVDARDVLLAQSQIHADYEARTHDQTLEIQDYQLQLDNQEKALEDLNQILNVRNITQQRHQRHLERQQHDIFRRTEEVQELRQRLTNIHRVLDSQVRMLFQSRLDLVATIADSTGQLMRADISLAKELEVVITLSETIQQVSRQARYLKLHSAIFINRPQAASLTGFSQITDGIDRLMTQSATADQRTQDSVGQIKLNISAVALAAQDIAQSTEGLIQQLKATDELLRELETLADPQNAHESLFTLEQNSGLRTVRSKMRLIDRVSQDLSHLYESEKPYNLRTMLQALEGRLRDR